jgi:hypothetical protein
VDDRHADVRHHDQDDVGALRSGGHHQWQRSGPGEGGHPAPSGFTDLASWLTANAADLALVDDKDDGLDDFVTSRGLDMGFKMGRDLTAHHWLVAELSHEAVD